jgi:hypothetical protein
MNRLASRRNFSTSFFFKITQTERVANDLSLFFAKKEKERRRRRNET